MRQVVRALSATRVAVVPALARALALMFAPALARALEPALARALALAFAPALAVLAVAAPADAHQIRPAVLALREVSPGRFAMHWSPPSDGTRVRDDLQPRFPDHCRRESETLLDCGERGLAGAIRFDGAAGASGGVSVDIEWFRGPRELRLASGDPPVLLVSGTPSRASFAERARLARSYAAMGVEHILSGADHLMFVAGLLLFVRSLRRLLLTITSFTVAHSVTLAASALNLVHAPRAPVELCIALSILLLAVEATRARPTWTHRAPWIVAFVFGLLHGFGFATALTEVGLPPQHVPLALASFNAGVEAGQLLAVAGLGLAYRAIVRSARAGERVQELAAFALGTASVYWCFERAAGMWEALR
ncbi:MAG: HupE/UreJ family protein [Myxococcales bacterium]|nr:HupE/UreJ family protein [Myxococcales bacterium]